jgi:transcriptional regulator with XRE-family HTH domain
MPPSKPQPLKLGMAIRRLRKERGLTQEGLAHAAGSTTATISSIERGRSNPNWSTVEAIASALDTSMVEIARLAEKHE